MSVIERERVEEKTVTGADALHRAADLLEEFGWTSGKLCRDSDGKGLSDARDPSAVSFCVSGAMGRAAMDLGGGTALWDDAFRILHQRLGAGPVEWNDRLGRTKAEVVSALRSAAEACHV
jgi:hypothetical protein